MLLPRRVLAIAKGMMGLAWRLAYDWEAKETHD